MGFISNLEGAFEAVAEDKSEPSSEDELFMPKCMNLHKAGLRCSDRIRQKKEKKESRNSHKAHVTYCTRIKRAIGLFTLLCTINEYYMPQHRLPKNTIPLQQFLNRMDEANEQFDGTLNQINYFPFVKEVGSNKTFTYHQDKNQADWSQFVLATEKEINDHESCNHWTLVPIFSLPDKAKIIK